MKVCILGARLHVGNLGCRALTVSLIRGIVNERPEAEITLLYTDKRTSTFELKIDEKKVPVRVLNYRRSPLAKLPENVVGILLLAVMHRLVRLRSVRHRIESYVPWIGAIAEAEFVGQIHGGDSFTDLYGIVRLTLQTIENCIVLLLQKPLIMLPQTYGPFDGRIAKRMGGFVLRRSALIFGRDISSVGIAVELIGSPNDVPVKHSPDVAFSLPVGGLLKSKFEPDFAKGAGQIVVGVNVSGLLYAGGDRKKNRFGLRESYQQVMNVLICELLTRPNVEILLIPHVLGDSKESDITEGWNCMPC